jgi:hypothetical protein
VAARGTGQTSVESLLSQLQQRAFALGGTAGATVDYQQKSFDVLMKMYDWLTVTLPATIGQYAREIYEKIVAAVLSAAGGVITGGQAAGGAIYEFAKSQLRQVVPGGALPFGL